MRTNPDITLGGRRLRDISGKIIVTYCGEDAAEEEVYSSTALPWGSMECRRKRNSLQVRAGVVIAEKDMARRRRIIGEIARWAREGRGKKLQMAGMDDVYIIPDRINVPGESHWGRWLEEMEIVFTAIIYPYWRRLQKVTGTSEGMEGSILMPLPFTGYAEPEECPADVYIRSKGGTISSLEIKGVCEGRETCSIKLENIASSELSIVHDENGILRIEGKTGEEKADCIQYRTEDSSDDLILSPGKINRLEYKCSVPIEIRCEV